MPGGALCSLRVEHSAEPVVVLAANSRSQIAGTPCATMSKAPGSGTVFGGDRRRKGAFASSRRDGLTNTSLPERVKALYTGREFLEGRCEETAGDSKVSWASVKVQGDCNGGAVCHFCAAVRGVRLGSDA